jgi:2-iminobutanoate/2-iminopropanoate deaminase
MTNKLICVEAPKAFPPGGHYSQSVRTAGMIFVSGQLGIVRGQDPATPVEQQTVRVLTALSAILETSGATLDHVAKVTIYVSDIEDWPIIDRLYADAFGDHRPARAIVPVPELHYGAALELEAIAVDPEL